MADIDQSFERNVTLPNTVFVKLLDIFLRPDMIAFTIIAVRVCLHLFFLIREKCTMQVKRSTLALVVAVLLSGCSSAQSLLESSKEPERFPTPVIIVKPEIDYSGEYPSCSEAGKRLAENVEVGMTLKDATRLVGQAKWRIPGSWWWSKSFTKDGKPLVRFALQQGRDDTVITAIVTDTHRCES